MGVSFKTSEVFDIAVELENSGERFYLAAAEEASGSDLRKIFRQLAEWEKAHRKKLEQIAAQINPEYSARGVESNEELVVCLRVIESLNLYQSRTDWKPAITGAGTEGILKKAVELEKDSVVYYEAIKCFVPSLPGREYIEKIIKEELQHIAILQQAIKKQP